MASIPDRSEQPRVFLWCMPRSISTCFLKCLSFVDDVQVWLEPYQIACVTECLRDAAQSKPEILNLPQVRTYIADRKIYQGQGNEYSGGCLMPAENFTFPWIKSQLEQEEPDKKYIFIKETAYSIYNHLDALPDVMSRHTFIIRHPNRLMDSYRRMIMRAGDYAGDPAEYELPSAYEDYFFNVDYMHLLWRYVHESGRDTNPVIIDAEDLVNYPEKILPKYLGALGIPYRESYTTWDASEKSIKTWKGPLEHFAWGKKRTVFDRAFASRRFLPNTHVMPKREGLAPDIKGIIDRIMPGYEEMYQHRIKPN